MLNQRELYDKHSLYNVFKKNMWDESIHRKLNDIKYRRNKFIDTENYNTIEKRNYSPKNANNIKRNKSYTILNSVNSHQFERDNKIYEEKIQFHKSRENVTNQFTGSKMYWHTPKANKEAQDRSNSFKRKMKQNRIDVANSILYDRIRNMSSGLILNTDNSKINIQSNTKKNLSIKVCNFK